LNLNNASAASIFFLSFLSNFSVCLWRAMDFLTTSAIFFFYSASYCFGDLGFGFDFLLEKGKSPLKSNFDASVEGINGSFDTFLAEDPLTMVGLTSPKAA
jgi:hypothetical protein